MSKNVKYKEFIATVNDFNNAKKAKVAKQAYIFWGKGKWEDLYQLFKENDLNEGWPPFDGFINYKTITLKAGTILDRYDYNGAIQPDDTYRGWFASSKKPNGKSYTFQERALKGNLIDYSEYYEIKLLEDIDIRIGEIIPWFNKVGKGVQIKFSKNIEQLLNEGKIQIINIKKINR